MALKLNTTVMNDGAKTTKTNPQQQRSYNWRNPVPTTPAKTTTPPQTAAALAAAARITPNSTAAKTQQNNSAKAQGSQYVPKPTVNPTVQSVLQNAMNNTLAGAGKTPVNYTPAKTAPSKTTPTTTTPSKTTPTKVSGGSSSSSGSSASGSPSKTTPSKTTPSKTTPSVTTPTTPAAGSSTTTTAEAVPTDGQSSIFPNVDFDAIYAYILGSMGDDATLRANIEGALKPLYQQNKEDLEAQRIARNAEIDVDAASRGMGNSTWVTDAKLRQMRASESALAALDANYNNQLYSSLADALQNRDNLAFNNAATLYNLLNNNDQWRLQFATSNDQWQQQFDWQKLQQELENSQWQQEFDFTQQKWQDQLDQWQAEFDQKHPSTSGSGSGGGSPSIADNYQNWLDNMSGKYQYTTPSFGGAVLNFGRLGGMK